MSSLIAFLAVDSRAPASIYIASDSKFSFDSNGSQHWEFGRKTYALQNSPDLFGYCGDVTFPSIILSQIVDLSDRGVLFHPTATSEFKFNLFKQLIVNAFNRYPAKLRSNFYIVHAARDHKGMASKFSIRLLKWSKQDGWEEKLLPLPLLSNVIDIWGSGKAVVQLHLGKWRKSDVGGTSRAIFAGFCDAIESQGDKLTGGTPQVVGLYRKGAGVTYGFIENDQLSVFGLPITETEYLDKIKWTNKTFENCDWKTKLLRVGQQPQPKPPLKP